ncbi:MULTISPECIES: bifunctional sugar-1-phosphate nucleotidylyltransferase/acetyltransferase [Methanoculleus]|uniref:Bifunctional protein GlmU n=2 Tax=Methanoculleus TaxID=45989 RepID=A3CXQ2_METMJ|nr:MULTISPECIES: bifunctional sugar-1-phosphate nucleotidylyltransferase/acetyltransferase [Methanoculleus]ABN58152.1 Nucleotidyl transferase [Methanoculleus marisnigri JR1]MCC7554817.1 NTP transferase domain-containing protein [Methanoculleus marisnigri]UYU19534.1 sugar phosphate nucleotidyltransferase [Methanoculleus submarinus]
MQCVVLAAGEGKRMRPLTARRPKVMLPIANRPMMEHLVVAARDAGITDFTFVVGYFEREIRNHFGDGSSLGVNIAYVTQRHQLGTADALRSTAGMIDDRFLLLNGDMILKSDDIGRFCRMDAPCVGIHETDHPQDYGVVTVKGGRITGLEEKSEDPKSNLINAGAYLFEPDIFDLLSGLKVSGRGEFELTDALETYINEGTLRAYSLAYWLDVGQPWDLLDANEGLLSSIRHERHGTVEDGCTVPETVCIGKGTVIRAGTYIEGACVIGENCVIGPHAYIRGSTAIGDNCHIGHATELKNSIIMSGTKIPHFNYIGDSIVGSNCNFGAGTKVANLRHDNGAVKVCGKTTGRRKFGAIIGDDVLFGINCSVNVGSLVGSGTRAAPHSLVEGCIEDNSIIR